MKNKVYKTIKLQRQKLKRVLRYAQAKLNKIHPKKTLSFIGGATVFLLVAHAVSFIWPHSLQFSYSGNNCFLNPVILPDTINTQTTKSFAISYKNNVNIGNLKLYSISTCVEATNLPNPNTNERLALGSIIKKFVSVNAPSYPAVASLTKKEKPISPINDALFSIAADQFFDYQLVIRKKSIPCQKQNNSLNCPLKAFKLAQTKTYNIKLQRLFRGNFVENAITQQLKTTAAIKVVKTSIKNGSKIYSKPKGISVRFNKKLKDVSHVKLELLNGKVPKNIPQVISFKDKTLNTKFTQSLPRQANFRLTIGSVDAKDDGFLDKPFVLKFATSGGPLVIGSYIPTQPDSSFSLTFDSDIAPGQQLQNFFKVERGGKRVAASVNLNGRAITIKPSNNLPICSNFTVKVLDGIKNKYGITGGSGWQINSRTICRSVISIGASVQGRSILAYKYGNGPKKVIFVGAIHGNEQSSTYMLNSLIGYLDSNPGQVPGDRTVIIIPIANPDGYAANNRCNAHGVDLNRNFPTGDWQSDVNSPGCSYGGSSALSEPESRALANYVSSQGARIVLSYHAVAGIVAANEAGNSLSLAHIYGQKSGYPSYGNEADDSYFDYDTTGAFENWMGERGIPGILIELRSNYGNEFYSHIDAMLAMIKS